MAQDHSDTAATFGWDAETASAYDAERDAYFAIVQQEIDAMDPVSTGPCTSEAVADDLVILIED